MKTTMEIDKLFKQALTGEYDDEEPWEAIHHLRAIGSREVFETAASWCGSDDPLQRARGADVLAQLGRTAEHPELKFSEESFAILAMMALNEQESQPLSSAILALGQLRDTRALPIIANYRSNDDPAVRFAVACACGNTPDEDLAADTLLELIEDEDADTREWAAFGLGSLSNLDGKEIRDKLAEALADPSDEVKQEAMMGLARRRDSRALPNLIAQLGQADLDETIFEAACMLLEYKEPKKGWSPRDYIAALQERYGASRK